MLTDNELERIKSDLKIDETKKSNLVDELERLKKKLQGIMDSITATVNDMNTIENFEKNINDAANNVQDAIIDMNSYFQGNLANNISKEYSQAEKELTDIHNRMVDEYNKLNEELANLKKEAQRTEEEITDVERRLGKINDSIDSNIRILQNSIDN